VRYDLRALARLTQITRLLVAEIAEVLYLRSAGVCRRSAESSGHLRTDSLAS